MKVKVVKKLKKGKVTKPKPLKNKPTAKPQNTYAEKYLEFYDDIKTPSRKNDW